MCFECGDEENTLNSKIIMNNRWLLNWPEMYYNISNTISEIVIATVVFASKRSNSNVEGRSLTGL